MNYLERLSFGFSKKLPIVLQTEIAECGLACLTSIAGDQRLQVPLDAGAGKRPRGAPGHQERRPDHPDRPLPAQDLAGRAAAVLQRAAGPDERGGPASARGGAQRDIPQADQGLHDPPQGQAGHHRAGPGQRRPRRNRHHREDGAAHPLRPGVPAPLVAAAGPEDHPQDHSGVVPRSECILRRGLARDVLRNECWPPRSR